jgi:hypothetical protein
MKAPAILLTVLLAATIGCSTGSTPVDAGIDSRSALSLWRSGGWTDYEYHFERVCFCTSEYVEPVLVEVRQGRIVAVTSTVDGEARSLTGPVPWYTVDDLFRLVQNARSSGRERLLVEYHPSGYPMMIEIGTLENDAGVRYLVGGVRRLD